MDLYQSTITAADFERAIKLMRVRFLLEEKDVNFWDYDGTLLYSYTLEEAQALTELPPLPVQPRLICQGWNWSLDQIKEHGAFVDVGALYTTADGATKLHISSLYDEPTEITLNFQQSVSNGVLIDWGDGSAKETISGTGVVSINHTFAKGYYIVSLLPNDDCTVQLGGAGSDKALVTSTLVNTDSSILVELNIGKNVTKLSDYCCYRARGLQSMSMPTTCTNFGVQSFDDTRVSIVILAPDSIVGAYSFRTCNNAKALSAPNFKQTGGGCLSGMNAIKSFVCAEGITNLYGNAFKDHTSLQRMFLPDDIIDIGQYALSGYRNLKTLLMPKSLVSIGSYALSGNTNMRVLDFTKCEQVPALAAVDALNALPTTCEIRVPSALYDEWVAATNWTVYASQIVGV